LSESKKLGIIIPARYESSRLPGKPLIKICGISMIQRTWMQCCKAIDKSNIYIATDNIEIAKHVESFGGNFVMTSKNCLTGTDRIAEANKTLNLDLIINVQGDEPIIDPEDIKTIMTAQKKNPNSVFNGMTRISKEIEINSTTIPKVVFSESKKLLYMSRSKIPGSKDGNSNQCFKQVCIYGFNAEHLEIFAKSTSKSKFEEIEDIEILRFIEQDIPVNMVELSSNSMSVDVPADILSIEKVIEKQAPKLS